MDATATIAGGAGMKIVKVVVDALPQSASRCYWATRKWDKYKTLETADVQCEFTLNRVLMESLDFVTQRCPNCPLVEEAEEVQE